MSICNATKKDGTPCTRHAVSDREHCYFHGRRRKRPQPELREAPELVTYTGELSQVARFLTQVVKETYEGTLDVKCANACVYGLSHLARILEAAELEHRVEALEKKLEAEDEGAVKTS